MSGRILLRTEGNHRLDSAKFGQLKIGISSGVSTPDKVIAAFLEKVFRSRNMTTRKVMVPESVVALLETVREDWRDKLYEFSFSRLKVRLHG